MKKMRSWILICIVGIFTWTASAQSEWSLSLLPQVAFGGRNTVTYPNDGQTNRISLSEEFNKVNKGSFAPRIELGYRYKRHFVQVNASLLRAKYTGMNLYSMRYGETVFSAGTQIDAVYRFNAYCIGYLYRLVDRERLTFDIGATLLIRDAKISMEGGDEKSSYTNVGVAPLLSYSLEWKALRDISLLTYGDAFGIKKGRAETIFAGIRYDFTPRISGLLGYRILEGGSDTSDIRTYATFHYASFGIRMNF